MTKPAIERSSVVLPQPELPSSAIISPRSTPRLTSVEHARRAVGNGQRFRSKGKVTSRGACPSGSESLAQSMTRAQRRCLTGRAAGPKNGLVRRTTPSTRRDPLRSGGSGDYHDRSPFCRTCHATRTHRPGSRRPPPAPGARCSTAVSATAKAWRRPVLCRRCVTRAGCGRARWSGALREVR